jgi:hypothetical protein
VKLAKKYGEECKVTIRKARHDALDMLTQIDTEGEASADEVDRAKKKAEETVAEAAKTGRRRSSATRKRTSSRFDGASRQAQGARGLPMGARRRCALDTRLGP